MPGAGFVEAAGAPLPAVFQMESADQLVVALRTFEAGAEDRPRHLPA